MTAKMRELVQAFENAVFAEGALENYENASMRQLRSRHEKVLDTKAELLREIEILEQCVAHDSAP